VQRPALTACKNWRLRRARGGVVVGEECYRCAFAALVAGPLLLQVTRHRTFVVCDAFGSGAHTHVHAHGQPAETVEKVKQLRVWSRELADPLQLSTNTNCCAKPVVFYNRNTPACVCDMLTHCIFHTLPNERVFVTACNGGAVRCLHRPTTCARFSGMNSEIFRLIIDACDNFAVGAAGAMGRAPRAWCQRCASKAR